MYYSLAFYFAIVVSAIDFSNKETDKPFLIVGFF